MTELSALSPHVVDLMLQLTRASTTQRVLAAGANAFDLYLDLLDRGFARVATTMTSRVPCGQYDIALIAEHHSVQATGALLTRLMPYLSARAVIALPIDASENRLGGKVQLLLERLGFRVEAGSRYEGGFVLSARRREWIDVAQAA
jgi:hypothetical protein